MFNYLIHFANELDQSGKVHIIDNNIYFKHFIPYLLILILHNNSYRNCHQNLKMSASHIFSQTFTTAQQFGTSLTSSGAQLGMDIGRTLANTSLTLGKSITDSVQHNIPGGIGGIGGATEFRVGSYSLHLKHRLAEGMLPCHNLFWETLFSWFWFCFCT